MLGEEHVGPDRPERDDETPERVDRPAATDAELHDFRSLGDPRLGRSVASGTDEHGPMAHADELLVPHEDLTGHRAVVEHVQEIHDSPVLLSAAHRLLACFASPSHADGRAARRLAASSRSGLVGSPSPSSMLTLAKCAFILMP